MVKNVLTLLLLVAPLATAKVDTTQLRP